MTVRRTVTTVDTLESMPTWSIPRGRTKAEQRLAALAALHQPIPRHTSGSYVRDVVLEHPQTYYICGECKTLGRSSLDGLVPVRWPCTTARLIGDWPGEPMDA